MACVDENAAVALLAGKLAASESAELLAHAADCDSCRQLVAALARATTWTNGERPAPAPRADRRRGDPVGRYMLLGHLGEGGMGVVYLGYDPDLDRRVALKFLRDAGDRQRLLREAKAIASLSHPHVVSVYDVGTAGDELFVAMEYVPGPTLREWLASEPRSWAAIVERFLQAGRGLAAAHAAGFVHRDFKPENVIVAADGRTRVLDFGLATHDATADVPGGTPRYMAPEQLASREIGPAADQFSFCVALYEALYGQHPFAAENAGTEAAMRPPPGTTRVPPRFAAILTRGLARDPAARYRTLDLLLAELVPRRSGPALAIGILAALVLGCVALFAFAGAREHPCSDGSAKLAGVWDGQRKATQHAAFLATHLPFANDAWQRVERDVDAYASQWRSVHLEACNATRDHEQSAELLDLRMQCLAHRLEDVKALGDVFAAADAGVVERASQAAESLTSLDSCNHVESLRAPVKAPTEPVAAARVEQLERMRAQIQALDDAGKYADALRLANAATREAAAVGHQPIRAQLLVLLGIVQLQTGDHHAEDSLFAAVQAAEAGRHDHAAADAWIRLVTAMTLMKRFPEAERWADMAQAVIARIGSHERLTTALEDKRAALMWAEGKPDLALAHAQTAVAGSRRLYGGDSEATAGALHTMGLAYAGMGELQHALDTFHEAVAIRERTLGSSHPLYADSLVNVANVLGAMGKQDEAIATLERSLAITDRAIGHDSADFAGRVDNLGVFYERLGRRDDAFAQHERALAIREKVLPPDDPRLAKSLAEMGDDLLDRERFADARATLSRAVASYRAMKEPTGVYYAVSLAGLGEAELALGSRENAIAALEAALALDHDKTAVTPAQRARMEQALARARASGSAGRTRAGAR